MSKDIVPRPLLVGLKFREQHSQVIQDELDNILASLQGQLGRLGVYTPVSSPVMFVTGGTWSRSANPLSTRVGYAVLGGLLFFSFFFEGTSISVSTTQLRLRLPGNYRLLADAACLASCVVFTSGTGFVPAWAYVDRRPGNETTELVIQKLDGTAFSTVAGAVSLYGQIVIPYQLTVS